MRTPAVLLAGLVLSACTTLRSPAPPRPGSNPTVYPVALESALAALGGSLAGIPGVERLEQSTQAARVEFDYLKFRGQVALVCLRGETGRTGWWPSVSLDGTRTVIAPWRIARLLAFYARLPSRAQEALAGLSQLAPRISRPEVVPATNCP